MKDVACRACLGFIDSGWHHQCSQDWHQQRSARAVAVWLSHAPTDASDAPSGTSSTTVGDATAAVGDAATTIWDASASRDARSSGTVGDASTAAVGNTKALAKRLR